MRQRHTRSYNQLVDIDPFLTPAGIAAAQRAGVPLSEVVDLLYSETSVHLGFVNSRAIWFLGTSTAGLIVVQCDRPARNVNAYEIVNVRLAGLDETVYYWRKRNG